MTASYSAPNSRDVAATRFLAVWFPTPTGGGRGLAFDVGPGEADRYLQRGLDASFCRKTVLIGDFATGREALIAVNEHGRRVARIRERGAVSPSSFDEGNSAAAAGSFVSFDTNGNPAAAATGRSYASTRKRVYGFKRGDKPASPMAGKKVAPAQRPGPSNGNQQHGDATMCQPMEQPYVIDKADHRRDPQAEQGQTVDPP
jgi:hypothetical protein